MKWKVGERMSLQQEIIKALGVKASIDVEAEIRRRVDFLKEAVEQAHCSGLLIAVSGGLDSAVVAALCKMATDELAAERDRFYETLAVLQPYGEQEDIAHSHAVVEAFALTSVVTNIAQAVDEVSREVEGALSTLNVVQRQLGRGNKGNVMARTRMVMQYALAAERNLLVVGTDHASEAIVGFFTKYGDGAVDIHPLGSLTKRQVQALAEWLGVPQEIIDKVPTAGLWEGQNDEDELGVSYDDNCDYLEGKRIDPQAQARLEQLYLQTAHKRSPIPRI